MNDDQLNVNTVVGSGYLDGYACWSSYGRNFYTKKISTFFALRTSTTAASTMRVKWTVLVMSSATFRMPRVPTGSSPNADYVSYSSAYFVNPDGNVNFSIHYVGLDSYGIK